MGKQASKLALHLESTALCHATENLDKVKTALLNAVAGGRRGPLEERLSVAMLEGYYGNPIYVLRLRVQDPQEASELFLGIVRRLDSEDLARLSSTLEQRLDSSGALHLRFDKQLAFQGRLRLYDGDDVIKVKVKLARHALEVLRGRGLEALVG